MNASALPFIHELPSIHEYYKLPIWERWPAMRTYWMDQLLKDKSRGGCVIECAMRDLLDTLHDNHLKSIAQ